MRSIPHMIGGIAYLCVSLGMLGIGFLSGKGLMADDRYALVIGVNRYSGDFQPLKYAGRDARGVGIALQRLGYNVTTMGNDQERGDLNPTNPDKILDKIRALAQSGRAGDTIVLFMSGHGCQLEGDTETYFCPSDVDLRKKESLLPVSAILQELEKSEARHRLVLMDACQERILTPEAPKNSARRIQIPNLVNAERLVPQKMAVFFSCSAEQRSFEDPDLPNLLDSNGEKGQGIFSHFVIKYLSGRASPGDYPGGVELDISSMERFVRTSTQKHADSKGKIQIPRMKMEGAFPLGRRPREWSDLHETPVAGLNLKRIRAGSFDMGASAAEIAAVQAWDPKFPEDYLVRAQPQHRVTLSQDFYIGLHEVTRGQFRLFVKETGYVTDCEKDGEGGWGIGTDGNFKQSEDFDWRKCGFAQTDDHPVVNVSWNDAVAFCAWLTDKGRRSGQLGVEESYRLPTEAEWEYSARGGNRGWYSFGDSPEDLVRYANVADASYSQEFTDKYRVVQGDDGFTYTSPVGSFRANGFGLFDMHGNVWEWCGDWYGEYPASSVTDPVGPKTGSSRVLRGGSWFYEAAFCRSANRNWYLPSLRDSDMSFGFRVALSPSGIPK